MQRIALALLVVGALALAAPLALRADEPPAGADAARIEQLVENLGSADFRIREAASKDLIEAGEGARAALEKATKSDVPEVRFRSEQILRRLDGKNREIPLEDVPAPPAGAGGFGLRFDEGEYKKAIEEAQRHLRSLNDKWTTDWPDRFRGFTAIAPRRNVFRGEGAELVRTPRSATLKVTWPADATGAKVTSTYEGKDLATILAREPKLRDHPGVAKVIEDAKKADEKAEKHAAEAPVPFSFSSKSEGVKIESAPGSVKVTVTENGPDGKPVTKTYEGTDIESLKRDHPELADKIGGLTFRFGVDDRPFDGLRLWPGRVPRLDPDTHFGDVLIERESTETGPFGLGLKPVDDALRSHLALDAGKGALVVAVREGSDAAKMGVQVHDVVKSVNGAAATFDGDTSVRSLIQGAKSGPMTMEVLRGGKTVTLSK